MAVEKETQFEAWLEENMPEPGGGNPNYVETIQTNYAEVGDYLDYDALLNYGATYIISSEDAISGTYELTGAVEKGTDSTYYAALTYPLGNTMGTIANYLIMPVWYVRPTDNKLILRDFWYFGDTDPEIAIEVPCTLTIIHHPLPEN